jgi:2-polyprenyl-3-methyl-5-hydroxy-6-metoxy-1,4-benzoquinol methylase
MQTTPSRADAVRFHGELASQWEQKYRKSSFARRQEVLRECLEGIALKDTAWLDAGCGTGTLARWLAEQGCRVEAVDAAPEMLRVAQEVASEAPRLLPITFRQVETVEALPFPANSFDGILCSSVLEYVSNPGACLDELGRVLRPNGVLLISVPSARSVVRRLLKAVHACTTTLGRPWPSYLSISRHQYSVGSFEELLLARGLKMRALGSLGTPAARWFPKNERLASLLMFCARKQEVKSA